MCHSDSWKQPYLDFTGHPPRMAYNIIGRFGRNLTTGTDHRLLKSSVTENEVREVLCIALLHLLLLTHRQGNFIHHLSVQLRRSYENYYHSDGQSDHVP